MSDGEPRRGYQGSWQQYDVVVESNVMVPLQDGVRLATDIYRPALGGQPVEGRFPVILERTPYDKVRTDLVSVGKFFARHGYIVALQDVRGRFRSEGTWYAFAHEGPDGYDTVEWLAAQPWSDGQVATIGLSYSGSDQSALASLNPPHLKAQFVSEGMSSYYKGSMRQGGAMEVRFVVYAFRMAIDSKEAQANPALRQALVEAHAHIRQWLGRMPLKKGASPLSLVPSYEQWVLDVLTHGDYGKYWMQPGYSVEEYYDQHADIPIYFLSGWYDSYTRATTDNFVALSRLKSSPLKLIMGPWIHGGANIGLTYSGDVDFGPEAAVDYNALRLRWFDYHLKGLDTGIRDESPVRIFVMGGGDGRQNLEGRLHHGGYWRYEQEWPPARAQYTNYYLHADGIMSTHLPGHNLPNRRSIYRFDPRDPVPTIGGNISAANEVMPPGGFDQRGRPDVFGARDTLPLAARHDVLVFQTAPLAEDVEVTGPLTVKLWASSSAVDTDFTAKLVDAYPPNQDYPEGYALNIADSIIRARYRHSWTQPEPMTPGEVYPLTIVLYPTANVFQAGHRIRLDISSSNFPRFDVNSNTGDPVGQSHRGVVAENFIYHDAHHPSHIVLPIVPAS